MIGNTKKIYIYIHIYVYMNIIDILKHYFSTSQQTR